MTRPAQTPDEQARERNRRWTAAEQARARDALVRLRAAAHVLAHTPLLDAFEERGVDPATVRAVRRSVPRLWRLLDATPRTHGEWRELTKRSSSVTWSHDRSRPFYDDGGVTDPVAATLDNVVVRVARGAWYALLVLRPTPDPLMYNSGRGDEAADENALLAQSRLHALLDYEFGEGVFASTWADALARAEREVPR